MHTTLTLMSTCDMSTCDACARARVHPYVPAACMCPGNRHALLAGCCCCCFHRTPPHGLMRSTPAPAPKQVGFCIHASRPHAQAGLCWCMLPKPWHELMKAATTPAPAPY